MYIDTQIQVTSLSTTRSIFSTHNFTLPSHHIPGIVFFPFLVMHNTRNEDSEKEVAG